MNKVKKIIIKTKRQVLSEVVGNNASLFKGEGYNFSEIREYQEGDDIRKIDWMVTAKLQKPYVKEFLEERELNISTISLLGGSMFFGSSKLKQDVLAEIVSIIAFSSISNGDMFSNYIYSPDFHSNTLPSRNIAHLQHTLKTMLDMKLIGNSIKLKDIQKDIQNRIKKKSILFFIGDFITDELHLHALSKKHEVIALIVRDKFEENPQNIGFINSIDPNTRKQAQMVFDKTLSKKYKDAIYKNDHNLYSYFRKNKIKFTKIYTNEEPLGKLRELFHRA